MLANAKVLQVLREFGPQGQISRILMKQEDFFGGFFFEKLRVLGVYLMVAHIRFLQKPKEACCKFTPFRPPPRKQNTDTPVWQIQSVPSVGLTKLEMEERLEIKRCFFC